MRINTRTGKLDLLKSETETISKFLQLARAIEKHGDDDVSAKAREVVDAVNEMSRIMLCGVLANAEGEPIAAPY